MMSSVGDTFLWVFCLERYVCGSVHKFNGRKLSTYNACQFISLKR